MDILNRIDSGKMQQAGRLGKHNIFTPRLIDSFTITGHLEGDEPVLTYSQNGNEIMEEEYTANIQSYETALTTLDWIQIQ